MQALPETPQITMMWSSALLMILAITFWVGSLVWVSYARFIAPLMMIVILPFVLWTSYWLLFRQEREGERLYQRVDIATDKTLSFFMFFVMVLAIITILTTFSVGVWIGFIAILTPILLHTFFKEKPIPTPVYPPQMAGHRSVPATVAFLALVFSGIVTTIFSFTQASPTTIKFAGAEINTASLGIVLVFLAIVLYGFSRGKI